MIVKENSIVPLGYGKYVRSDKIVALEPIEEDRGPGRRTRVYVEEMENPIIASRTENSIIANISEVPREMMESTAAYELLQDIYDDLRQIGPMLRKSIKIEANFDLDKIQKRIEEILNHEIEFDIKQ
jgi:cation transport regulator ChaC